MRLTLRTVLAWMDGVMPAAEAEPFGRKVEGSTAAKTIVDRIRATVGHSGIDAPRIDGRGLGSDPNSVAEYLTNALPLESVAGFERVCLESDAHLADVAASHRLLAEARGDDMIFQPPDPATRLKLLAAMGVASAGIDPPAAPTPTAMPQSMPQSMPAARGSQSAWWLAGSAVLLLLALLAVLVWQLQLLPRMPGAAEPADVVEKPTAEPAGETPAATPPSGERLAATATESDAAFPAPATEPQPGAVVAESAASTPAQPDERASPVVPAATESAPPANPPVSGPAPPPPRVPGGDALAIGAGPPTVRAEPAAPSPAVQAPPSDTTPPPLAVAGPQSLFLVRKIDEAADAAWAPVVSDAPIVADSDIIVPPGPSPILLVGGVTVRLEAASRAVVSSSPDGSPMLELVFGRAVVSGLTSDRMLAVRAGGLEGMLAGPAGVVGIEVLFDRKPGVAPATMPAEFQARFVFPAGGGWQPLDAAAPTVALLPADGRLPPGSVILVERTPLGSGEPAGGRVESTVGPVPWLASAATPGWLDRSASAALAAKLVSSSSVSAALGDLFADARSENRVAAATTSALLGDYGPLVELLSAEGPGRQLPGTAWTALERAAVPLALSRGTASAERYRQAVAATLPRETAALVEKMSIGFSDEDLAAGADRLLVESLGHASLAVRRFAAERLFEIVLPPASDRLRFRPEGPPQARAEALKWWQAKLEKGLIRRTAAGGLSKAAAD